MPEGYWALWEGEDFANMVRKKVANSQRHMLASGLWWMWVKAHGLMIGMGKDGYSAHSLDKKGKLGEYTSYNVNHWRSIAKRYRLLAYGDRPVLDPQAPAGSPTADDQVRRARSVFEHYGAERGWEDVQLDVIKYASFLGAAWEYKEWNPKRGGAVLPPMEPTAPGDAAMPAQHTGDFQFWALKPNDVYFDPGLNSPLRVPWVVLRLRVSRWNLMADFPERAEDIRSLRRNTIDRNVDFALVPGLNMPPPTDDEDLVQLYVFLHEDEPAVPGGRFALLLSSGAPLMPPTELPGGIFPARALHEDDFPNSAHGYSTLWDLMGPQDYVNQSQSIKATIQRAHGVGIIATPKGSDFDPTMITRGLALLKYNAGMGKPELLNFTGTPSEVIQGGKDAVSDMEALSGVNSVARGDPQASLRTGPALVAVLAQASQYSLDFQRNISRYLSKSGQDLLRLFEEFADEPMTLLVTGERGTDEVTASGKDVAQVRKVRVDPGNPLARTLAGRMELGATLMQLAQQNNQPLDFGQYLRVVETGRAEVMTSIPTGKRLNIDKENELLLQARFIPGPPDPVTGQPTEVLDPSIPMPRALATDDLKLHVQGHLAKLESPEARANKALVRATLTHCAEHIQTSTNAQMSQPALLEAAGLQPLQAIQGMVMAMAGAAPPGQGTEQGPGGPPGAAPGGPQQKPGAPAMPKQPGQEQAATGVNPEAPGPGGFQ